MKQLTWDLYGEIRRAFDALGGGYDAQFPMHPMVHRARAIAAEHLARLSRPGEWWLELGCGTGRDAIPLAERGVNVLATDISDGMLSALESKLEGGRRGAGEIRTRRLAAAEVGSLESEWRDTLSGAFAYFGALNGEPDLPLVAEGLARVLRPGKRFLAAVSSRYCVWEWLLFLIRGRWNEAFRRQRTGTAIRVGGRTVNILTWTPRQVVKGFSPWFTCESITGLNVLTPPHYTEDPGRRLGRVLAWLDRLDRLVCGWPWMRGLGDHFLVEMRRN